MFEASEASTFPPDLVVVVDTSILIEFKRQVPIGRQWQLLELMSQLVDLGELAYPQQVQHELVYGQHPDAPSAWAANRKGHARHGNPSDEVVAEVLGEAPLLVDANAERDYADPYVAAMAMEIMGRWDNCRAVVATTDCVDRLPLKEALTSACERLDVEHWPWTKFWQWLTARESALKQASP